MKGDEGRPETRPKGCRALAENTEAARVILRALANESRMQILCCLAAGERSVSEIMTCTSLRQPVVSQQLAMLRELELVDSRRDGKGVFYTLTSTPVRMILQSLDDMFEFGFMNRRR